MLINNSKKIVIKLGSSTVIDKSGKFKTEVKNKFYAKSNKDKRYEIIYCGNVNDIAEDRGLLIHPFILIQIYQDQQF